MRAGRFRDPLIGRDVLFGALGAWAINLWWFIGELVKTRLDLPPFIGQSSLRALSGVRQAAGEFLGWLPASLSYPFAWLLIVLLLRLVLRRDWAVVALIALGAGVMGGASAPNPLLGGILIAVSYSLFFILLIRFGFLCAVFAILFNVVCITTVFTTDLSSWYAGRSMMVLLILAGTAIYGFYISLAGRPLLQRDLLGH